MRILDAGILHCDFNVSVEFRVNERNGSEGRWTDPSVRRHIGLTCCHGRGPG